MYNSINVDLFDILENDLFLYGSLGSVFICGDFNSRVGQKSDFIIFDKANNCCDCLIMFSIAHLHGPLMTGHIITTG